MKLDFSEGKLTLIVDVDEKGRALVRHFCYGEPVDAREKKAKFCPLAEVHVTGENADDHHGMKHMGSYGAFTLTYVSHSEERTKSGKRVAILLTNGRMNVTVHYEIHAVSNTVIAYTEVENIGAEALGLEYVSSFVYAGLDDADTPPAAQNICVGVPHNATFSENHWQLYDQAQMGFLRYVNSTKRFSVSNSGTWSCKEYLPMAFLENRDSGHCWLWQIEHNGSWQWELSESSRTLALRAGGPNEQENGWYKALAPGERFESVRVAITVAPNAAEALASITRYRRSIAPRGAQQEAMPVIFNDYMNCLFADPTEEKELPMIDAAAAAGAEYYCMDAGWYANGAWWETVGEWLPYEGRFPNGIKRVFDYVREKGMIPGIWLEIEVMGIGCPLAKEWEDACFFLRHGKRVIDHGRYQLDFRHPKVRAHATAVVDRVVREYGVGYIKMDYNIEAGLGTEVDADSFGDGLLAHQRAYLAWLEETLAQYPDLVWENCSSGGMRMDYAMLRRAHLQSVTDQTDYKKMVHIAAAAPMAALPEQAAIWSYPLADADADAVVVNMINAMLQRIHLSGKMTQLSDEAFALVQEGVATYKSYRRLLLSAVPHWPLGIPTHGNPFEALEMACEDRTLVAVWRLQAETDTVAMPLSAMGQARVLYPSDSDATVAHKQGELRVTLPRRNTAVLIEIRKTV